MLIVMHTVNNRQSLDLSAKKTNGEVDRRILQPVRRAHSLCCSCSPLVLHLQINHSPPPIPYSIMLLIFSAYDSANSRPFSHRIANTLSLANDNRPWDCRSSHPLFRASIFHRLAYSSCAAPGPAHAPLHSSARAT